MEEADFVEEISKRELRKFTDAEWDELKHNLTILDAVVSQYQNEYGEDCAPDQASLSEIFPLSHWDEQEK